ncbi:MAG: hypothetical protein IJ593_11055 [Lachnospiraceae bacterium]|nr:hypothetical protein [Lachnospiraceae bacterium]
MGNYIEYKDIPDKVFVKAILIRDIAKARLLSKEEKQNIERGSPDIEVISIVGGKSMVDRNSILANYKYTNNKRVKTYGWKSGKEYVIYRDINDEVYVFKVPTYAKVKVGNKVANYSSKGSGDYIICLSNERGIDRANVYVVSSQLFRKLGFIQNSDTIDKCYNKPKNSRRQFNLIAAINKIVSSRDNGFSLPLMNDDKPVQPDRTNYSVSASNNYTKPANGPKGQVKLVGQIHNSFGKRIGYIVMDSNGKTGKINKNAAVKLAYNHKISNAEAVKTNSEYFLRGNGIAIEKLPITYQDE